MRYSIEPNRPLVYLACMLQTVLMMICFLVYKDSLHVVLALMAALIAITAMCAVSFGDLKVLPQ